MKSISVLRLKRRVIMMGHHSGGIRAVASRYRECDATTSSSGNPGHNSWLGGSNGDGATRGDGKPSGESNKENDIAFILQKLVPHKTHLI